MPIGNFSQNLANPPRCLRLHLFVSSSCSCTTTSHWPPDAYWTPVSTSTSHVRTWQTGRYSTYIPPSPTKILFVTTSGLSYLTNILSQEPQWSGPIWIHWCGFRVADSASVSRILLPAGKKQSTRMKRNASGLPFTSPHRWQMVRRELKRAIGVIIFWHLL